MNLRIFLFLCIVWLVVIAAGCSRRVVDSEQVSREEKIVIKFSHVVAENTPKGLAAQRFANLVKERTGGRVEVQVFPNSVLYKDGEEIQALQAGAVQMIAPATSKLSLLYPQWQVFDLPYAFADEEAVHRAMESYLGKKLYDGLKANNLVPLSFWGSGFKQMTNSVRPLIKPEDFQGLTFRVMINSQVLKRQFEKLGAHPVEGTFDNLYRVLESRAVDGEENTLSNIFSKNFYKVQPYLTISNHGYMGYVVMTNSEFWSSLPEDVRNILESTLQEVTEWEHEQALQINRDCLKQIISSGMVQVHYQTEDEKREWVRALRPLYEEFREIIGEDLIDYLEESRQE
ncbi:MAG: TRAP transporter substrate-binding protein [Syntrophothermus sp.]|uniref:TRAP-type C4-dicarboxylate transport system, periplasmic component n=1 Tax=Pelotomaculum thermopropionicum (strain DSM 13744 / JCM 10971 / SI) TaxID=370438 RepID=A5D2L4_PELTS|nr:TRAP transporter substrate-binding protein [Syntrophothermus sp.]NSW82492.1 TRAP transporter substrate-binding protein [Syntrophothermus sp.]BAF59532.1 TRAP-type C4-dicarboxylate transport system, periplasmic component [Pelotomaculum thermopropionicum SI]